MKFKILNKYPHTNKGKHQVAIKIDNVIKYIGVVGMYEKEVGKYRNVFFMSEDTKKSFKFIETVYNIDIEKFKKYFLYQLYKYSHGKNLIEPEISYLDIEKVKFRKGILRMEEKIQEELDNIYEYVNCEVKFEDFRKYAIIITIKTNEMYINSVIHIVWNAKYTFEANMIDILKNIDYAIIDMLKF